METIVSGAEFHDFEKTAKVIGILGESVKREKDGERENQKAGSVMGYLLTLSDNNTVIIGNSFSIEKAVNEKKIRAGEIILFEFLGKGTNSKNLPFNRLKIARLSDVKEWAELEGRELEDSAEDSAE